MNNPHLEPLSALIERLEAYRLVCPWERLESTERALQEARETYAKDPKALVPLH